MELQSEQKHAPAHVAPPIALDSGMNDQQFWDLIESSAKKAKDDPDSFLDAISDALTKLGPQGAKAFDQHLATCMTRSYSWPLWGAAYIMCGGCSDDGFDYWRQWLIAQGQRVWSAAIANPESLASANLRFGDEDEWELEGLTYIPSEVYEELTGKELQSAISTSGDPDGERWDEDELAEMFPELTERFSHDAEDDGDDDDGEFDDDEDDEGDGDGEDDEGEEDED